MDMNIVMLADLKITSEEECVEGCELLEEYLRAKDALWNFSSRKWKNDIINSHIHYLNMQKRMYQEYLPCKRWEVRKVHLLLLLLFTYLFWD